MAESSKILSAAEIEAISQRLNDEEWNSLDFVITLSSHEALRSEVSRLRQENERKDQERRKDTDALVAGMKARKRLLDAIQAACGIIEVGDQRLLASDGPAGNQPPDLSLAEWRKLYVILDKARALDPTLSPTPKP